MKKYDGASLATSLRVQRAKLDMSQGELAQRAGVSVYTVQKYEDGTMTPGADKLFAMCEVLGCTPNELLGW